MLPAKNGANEKLAEILNGLIRNIEVQSDADACYAIAAENAAIAGQGAFRLNTVYWATTASNRTSGSIRSATPSAS